jgi:hypothetical protein
VTVATLRPTGSVTSPGIGGSVSTTGGTHEAVTADNNTGTYSQLTAGAAYQDFEAYNTTITYNFTIPVGAVSTSRQFRVNIQGVGAGELSPYSGGYFNALYGETTRPAVTTPTYHSTATVSFAVRTNGQSQVVRVAEAYYDVTYFTAPNAPTSITPNSAFTTGLRPTINWTHNGGASGGSQAGFQVKIFTTAQAAIGGFNPETSPHTIDSGVIQSVTSAYLLTSDLINGAGYVAYVKSYNGSGAVRTDPSAWSAGQAFSIAVPVPTPTSVTPSTAQTTSRPALNAQVASMAGGVYVQRQWDIATNNIFTTGLVTVTSSLFANSHSSPESFPALPTRLPQGTWYIRARAIDSFGVAGSWSTTQTFTIAHAPTTNSRLPNSGISYAYTGTTYSPTWVFQDIDTEDFQLKYEAEVWKLSDPAGSLKTTGIVTSGAYTGTWTGLDATWKDTELRWRVRVTDQDNVTGAWSSDQAFFLRDLPTIAITLPTEGQVIADAQPVITWTFSASGGRTMASSRLVITNLSNSTVIVDSGVVPGANLSYALTSPVILVSTPYSATLTTIDSTGLVSVETNLFTATYASPTQPIFTIDSVDFALRGRNVVDWSTSVVDGTNLYWKVLRRQYGYSTWTEIARLPTGIKLFEDYTAPASTLLEYSVVQTAESFGLPVDSPYPIQQFEGESSHYILVVPENDAINLTLYIVTSDDFEDEQEMATTNLIGRGRRVEYGTRFGITGSLTADFRDNDDLSARAQRQLLEAIRDSQLTIYLRTPFGDVWPVALESARVTRVSGVGLRENATASISYIEITA